MALTRKLLKGMGLTDEQVEIEIERLLNSDDVKLAKKETHQPEICHVSYFFAHVEFIQYMYVIAE